MFLMQRILKPQTEGDWAILNLLRFQGVDVRIIPGAIVAYIPNPIGGTITPAELQERVTIPCRFIATSSQAVDIVHTTPQCPRRRRQSPLQSARRLWIGDRRF